MKVLNVNHFIVLICLLLFSCNIESEVAKHRKESIHVLSAVVGDLKDTTCTVVVHSYGEYLTPIITNEDLEKELTFIDTSIAFSEVKRQGKLAKGYSRDFLIFKNQIMLENYLNVIRQSKQSSSNAWNQIAENFGCVRGISIPVFTKNYKYAFVYEYSINGKLNGGGSCLVYQKEKDKWNLVKVFNEWTS